ncbi:MAG: hypothetical protein NTZ78_00950 [Candidatus Aureabacteria bacterium]|nr:hypothetical protein [Candidatus Auribacterota bacterium]
MPCMNRDARGCQIQRLVGTREARPSRELAQQLAVEPMRSVGSTSQISLSRASRR